MACRDCTDSESVTMSTFFLLLQRTYIFTFLLSSRLFMHPYELMAKVCHLCVEHQRLSEGDSDKVMQHLSLRLFFIRSASSGLDFVMMVSLMEPSLAPG